MVRTVQMTLSRVIDKMVVDGGRALQPCRYRWCTHMSCIIIYPYSTYPCRGYGDTLENTYLYRHDTDTRDTDTRDTDTERRQSNLTNTRGV